MTTERRYGVLLMVALVLVWNLYLSLTILPLSVVGKICAFCIPLYLYWFIGKLYETCPCPRCEEWRRSKS